MNKKRLSIGINFIYNILYEVFRIVVPLLTTPYISRVLGADGVGTFTLAQTYAQYFILFAGLGFSTYAARELVYVRDDEEKFQKTYMEIFIARMFLLAIAVILYWGVFFVMELKGDISYKICIIYLIASAFDISYYFKAIENFRTVAIRNIIVKVMAMILVFMLVKDSSQVWLYTLIIVMAEFVGQGIMLLSVEKSMWRISKIKIANIKHHLMGSLSLFIPALAIQMYTMLDKVMIGEICGEGETGYYENAQKMVRLASTIASSIVAVSVPRMSYYFASGNREEFKNHLGKVFSLVSFLCFPMCFGLIAVASNFSNWYYGSNFTGINILVMMGAPLIISLGWSNILGNMILIASGRQKYYTIAVYIGAALNVCMNAILIPQIGARGAMIASDLAEFVGMIVMFVFCQRIYDIISCLKNIWVYFFSAIVMCIIVKTIDILMPYGILSTALEIFIGGLFYMLLMIKNHDDNIYRLINTVKKIKTRNGK